MIVICKKSTKKLIKGHRYEVSQLFNGGGNARWQEGKLVLKDVVGRFSVDNFTDTSGNPVPNTNIIPKRTQEVKRVEFSELKKGDILVCTSDSYTLFAKGCMYKISDLILKKESRTNWSGQKYEHTEQRIKFEGINRWIKFSSWSFRNLTTEEQRENQLNSLLLSKDPDVINQKIRKIELVPNKNVQLIKTLCQSVLDPNRHHLGVLDWSVEKTGTKLKINKEDYSELLNMKLSDILNLIDKK
jgi:hypothetical protein